MSVVKVSPKYQIVIPKDVRKELSIRPGMNLNIMVYNGQLKMVPSRTASEMRGILKGYDIDYSQVREKGDNKASSLTEMFSLSPVA